MLSDLYYISIKMWKFLVWPFPYTELQLFKYLCLGATVENSLNDFAISPKFLPFFITSNVGANDGNGANGAADATAAALTVMAATAGAVALVGGGYHQPWPYRRNLSYISCCTAWCASCSFWAANWRKTRLMDDTWKFSENENIFHSVLVCIIIQ